MEQSFGIDHPEQKSPQTILSLFSEFISTIFFKSNKHTKMHIIKNRLTWLPHAVVPELTLRLKVTKDEVLEV